MNENQCLPYAWKQYEAGKAYKERIGLYDRVRRNERFYRGDQWYGIDGGNLPKPVFNVIRRVVDYLVCSVARAEFQIRYTDENLPFCPEEKRESLNAALDALSDSAAIRWENSRMDRMVYRLLSDAAITGDGVLYCYWDPDRRTGQPFRGDIVTEAIDSTNLFVADVNRADLQSQEYIILSGRETVKRLREEAMQNGRSYEEAMRIRSDREWEAGAGDHAAIELSGEENEKATFLLYFTKKDGVVQFEKSTRDLVIRTADTGCRLYPVAYFNWYPTKNSFHGTSPVTGLIPNQKYINKAYAMVMKHMQDTAFSKVIYDKSKIPSWSNEVGEAIAAMGGGNISDAVQVVGVGQMQDGYTDLIRRAIEDTKEMIGATEAALGDTEATNTSAILALQESSQMPLRQVRIAFMQCLEDLGDIWADMICAYYPKKRLIPTRDDGERTARAVDFSVLREEIISARVSVQEINRYSAAAAQNLLDQLLVGGYITPAEYLKRIPAGTIAEKDALIALLNEREESAGDANE
ncbi:MAG: hypothetical protein J6B77_02025 [Clostridia bacterium]|nr:hypothetical protein [Clostridia bacterium]